MITLDPGSLHDLHTGYIHTSLSFSSVTSNVPFPRTLHLSPSIQAPSIGGAELRLPYFWAAHHTSPSNWSDHRRSGWRTSGAGASTAAGSACAAGGNPGFGTKGFAEVCNAATPVQTYMGVVRLDTSPLPDGLALVDSNVIFYRSLWYGIVRCSFRYVWSFYLHPISYCW